MVKDLNKKSEEEYFYKKEKIECGRVVTSEFRTKSGWILRCISWPSTGGRSFIRIPIGEDKQEWKRFGKMLEDFKDILEYKIWFSFQTKFNTIMKQPTNIDIVRINQVMKNEGFEEVSISSNFELILPANSIPSTQRNPHKLSERLLNHLHQRSTSTHRKCKASSDSGKSPPHPPVIGSSVGNQIAEIKWKSENFKRRSKSESPFRRALVFPPKETSFNCIPFEKSLEGFQQSHICSIKDNINVVSRNKSAKKSLIITKAN
ncbi:hypothetical protein Csa_015271, partial [Cucumis sativus]